MQVPQLRLALARCTPPVVASCSRPQMLVSQTWKVLARCTPPRAYSITGAGAAYTLTTCNGAPVSRRKGGQNNLAGHTNSASHLRQLARKKSVGRCSHGTGGLVGHGPRAQRASSLTPPRMAATTRSSHPPAKVTRNEQPARPRPATQREEFSTRFQNSNSPAEVQLRTWTQSLPSRRQ